MSLLVVGATGTLGRQVVRRALDEGHSVRCLVRSPRKAAFLREWGADLVKADLCQAQTLPFALEGITTVIDASTHRPTDPGNIWTMDWDGKVALIQAAQQAGVEHFIFFSILGADQYPKVPLMDVKACTEQFLRESGLNYTVLALGGFLQGLIGQYAIPILEKQTVWVTGEATPIAYMNTQDIAKFAVRSATTPATRNHCFPVVGNKAWDGYEIIGLCERLSGQDAKIARLPIETLRIARKVANFFEWGWNLSDRLAFSEVLASGQPLAADMAPVYETFGLDPKDMTTLEAYFDEYFGRMMRKLKKLGYDKEDKKRKMNF
ncbi:SDR family oxidoreductase [Prochlorothrix hollandica]|uniref:3-beta hydroxysteroid dehydrogenase n=1 Tax=Prochlorothrix hollandica PCC 9006 = CALU 1027 TaxID=317619 RepID=A0A0M2PVX2_PROHO|nr:SDR family oxidoreductase [Prochlorothrix hollandica]KKI99247.1 3-beta hydroxysteroid dehydrogenase [Prochlorothrix hollandica PCC 9006 = CALU 1027]